MLGYCDRLTNQSDTYTHGQTAWHSTAPLYSQELYYFLFSLYTAGYHAALCCIINPYTCTRGGIGLIPSLTNFLLHHSDPAPLPALLPSSPGDAVSSLPCPVPSLHARTVSSCCLSTHPSSISLYCRQTPACVWPDCCCCFQFNEAAWVNRVSPEIVIYWIFTGKFTSFKFTSWAEC